MVASLSSEAAGLRSEFFKPSGKPSTSRPPSSGKVRRRAPCLHHARFLLSRSVLHCADASFRTPLPRASGKARLLPASPAFVPHSGTPGADSHSGIAPLPVMPGLDAPGTSVRPLRLRVLRRVCRDLRSRHPCLLRPLRLHCLTQVPSAGPALTCEDGWRRALIRVTVPEPERPSSPRSNLCASGS